MHDLPRYAAPIPLDWSPDDALVVETFLQEILDTIWRVHGDGMDRLLQERRQRQYVLTLSEPPELDSA